MILDIIQDVGVVALLGAVVWLIRLEGMVKRNTEELKRLSGIEQQTAAQEISIKQRDEEMKALKHSLDEVKGRMEKLETKQMDTVEQLAKMDTKLDILLTQERREAHHEV